MAAGYKNPSRSLEQQTDREENTQLPETTILVDEKAILYITCRLLQLARTSREASDEESVVIKAEMIALRALKESNRVHVTMRQPLPLDAPHAFGNNQDFAGNHITALPNLPVHQPEQAATIHDVSAGAVSEDVSSTSLPGAA